MKRLTIALLAALALPSIVAAQRVVDYPEDSQKWYLTAIYSSIENPTEKDLALAKILRTDPRLQKLIAQVIFTEWDDSNTFVKQTKWKTYLGTNRPALLLQTPAKKNGDATVIFFASGPYLKTDHRLADQIKIVLDAYEKERKKEPAQPSCPDGKCPRPIKQPNCPDGRCPLRNAGQPCPRCPQPSPQPQPQPEPGPAPQPVEPIPPTFPDDPPVIEEEAEETPVLLYLLPAAGAGFALYRSLKEEAQV